MEFTNKEQERINQLYGNDFDNITGDDIQLIARWEAAKAMRELDYQAKLEALQTETKAKIAQSEAVSEKAMSDLEELKNAAMARLERLG